MWNWSKNLRAWLSPLAKPSVVKSPTAATPGTSPTATVTQRKPSPKPSYATCPLCRSADIEIIYRGWIRDGKAPSAVGGQIEHCNHCDLGWLEPRLRKPHNFYETNTYRKLIPYDTTDEVRLIRDRLIPFQRERFRGKTVTDIGAGNGLFLDVAKAMGARATYYTEPNTAQAAALEKRHDPSRGIKTAYVTLFDVIEHVGLPLALLAACKTHMTPWSKLVISTPRTATPIENPGWFYRTQHTWYFSDKSLERLCTKAGLFRTRQWVTGKGDREQLYQTYILSP